MTPKILSISIYELFWNNEEQIDFEFQWLSRHEANACALKCLW